MFEVRALADAIADTRGQDDDKALVDKIAALLSEHGASEVFPLLRIAINFAGGAGGDPQHRPWNPCQADRIAETYGKFGAKARIATLWLYSVNDAYWGPDHPKNWAAAYTARGGRAEFVSLPAYGSDGHQNFRRNAEAWQPKVDAFLKKNGF